MVWDIDEQYFQCIIFLKKGISGIPWGESQE
jgi:hypothetical protein